MAENPHFETVPSWEAAGAMLTFEPLVPSHTAGFELQSLSVYVMDHKMRKLPVENRSLEAHYGGFVLTQAQKDPDDARRWALEVSYGGDPAEARVAGRKGRVYELGPEVPPEDIDGRMPAVVVWYEDDRFYLIASDQMAAQDLLRIAGSLYA